MEHRIYKTDLAGRELSLEFGRYAEQASGSVLVRYGDTAVLVCATVSASPRPGIDFFPLGCDFEEKLYSVGKIPGGFIKREGRPTEKAVLTSRLIDRPLRPLFPKGFRNDVSVVATVLSNDNDNSAEIPAMIGSSIALAVSPIPFGGPTGSVVVGLVDGEFVLNPNLEQREKSDLHLTVSGTKDAIMMVEAGAREISEETMLSAILFAHEEIKRLVAFQEGIIAEIGQPKAEFTLVSVREDLEEKVQAFAIHRMEWVFETFDREERSAREKQVKQEALDAFLADYPDGEREIGDILYAMQKKVMRANITKNGVRPDGRALTQVRPIWCEAGILPRPHGSAVFTRGQTQVMSVVTLGAVGDQQKLDGISEEEFKRYMHHYNMPPYSTGESRPLRSPGRREIGHGALAERALEPMIPDEESFPYAIRVVSEAISSNGSTSMGSVCGSTLALMDAGVPLKKPVAGCAMGLIQDEASGKISVLTDIQGLEDFLGDMDFKVAGTKDGITAIQMDIKIKGIDEAILRQALAQAYEGRMHIMGKMLEVLDAPRESLSKYAPKIISFSIDPEKIREVIGSGGKVINKIIADTGVKIDIEDDGRVFIATPDEEAAAKARHIIESIAGGVEVGQEFVGKVVRIIPIGAFVELVPGKDGMLHISKLAPGRVEKVEDAVSLGDIIPVRVSRIDQQGRVDLVRTDIVVPERPPRPAFNREGGDRRPPFRPHRED
ncbi:MAG: polyribonucleotide nucleotidyltransferase [Christensenellaceae bacterium]|jgi:polyribonucleotide nucleotidyltransferase|nr:polyribonucleotide nucleotidyltransferase [Christensenellaceae bacterium]